MVLARAKEAFDHPEWIFEPKLDGFRALAYVDDVVWMPSERARPRGSQLIGRRVHCAEDRRVGTDAEGQVRARENYRRATSQFFDCWAIARSPKYFFDQI
jgi:hypothetical protein